MAVSVGPVAVWLAGVHSVAARVLDGRQFDAAVVFVVRVIRR